MQLNNEQQRAVDSSCNKDVVVSAGAGSGKTKTLTIKIYEKVSKGEIKPSELLVLTFTKNAAHEMKERVIKQFKDNNSPFADEMMSAHIQTFDSFLQYLVTRYSSELNLPKNLSLANESILKSKKNEFLEEVFNEYYNDPEKQKRLLKSLKKFNLCNDDKQKQYVLALFDFLDKKIASDRNFFIETYDRRFFSDEYYIKVKDELTKQYKKEIREGLIISNIMLQSISQLFTDDGEPNIEMIRTNIQDKSLFVEYKEIDENYDQEYQGIINRINEALEKEDSAFIEDMHLLLTEDDTLSTKKGKSTDGRGKYYKVMRKYFSDVISRFDYLYTESDSDYEYYYGLKEDVHLLFEMEERLRQLLWQFKLQNNYFSFSDIASLALTLLYDPKYEKCADEIRHQFKFIMVDEYQDTNDVQEAFLASLLKPCDDLRDAHIFCVGDAKQSIYGFRNSNVALFNKRIDEYSDNSSNHEVIPMNRNYRSKPEVLADINYIFNRYMTKNHGDIDFINPLQQLICGFGTSPDPKRKRGYGINRITYEPSVYFDNENNATKECLCIIHDIQQKMASGMTINEFGKERPVTYSDFCILVRKGNSFRLYQRLFRENGIPLNIIDKSNLREVDAIILIQSLLSLIHYYLTKESCDVKHLFTSVARSYIYQYSDDQIYRIISKTDDEDPYKYVKDDPIFKDIEAFCDRHHEEAFSTFFLSMLNDFSIVSKLYLLGQVENNVSQIESFYKMILSLETIGSGRKEFLDLLHTISKYQMDIDSKNVCKIEDAVDMMTIHASKGLEKHICYMPITDNSLTKQTALNKPALEIDDQFGIPFDNYNIQINNDEVLDVRYLTLPSLLKRAYTELKNPEVDEHVRLFYVALTRAIDSIIIVGNDPEPFILSKDRKNENYYGMLSYVFHKKVLNPKIASYLEELKKKEPEKIECIYKALNDYLEISKLYFNLPHVLRHQDFSSDSLFYAYEYIYNYLSGELETKCKVKYFDFLSEVISSFSTIIPISSEENPVSYSDKDILSFYFSDERIQSLKDYDSLLSSDLNSEDLSPDEDSSSESEGEEIDDISQENFETSLTIDILEKEIKDSYEKWFANKEKDSEKVKVSNIDNATKLAERIFYYLCKQKEIFFWDYHFEDQNFSYFDYHEHFDTCSFVRENRKDTPEINNELMVSDENIIFEKSIHQRASSYLLNVDEENNDIQTALEKGIRLHRLLELVSFTTRDTSFIKDNREKKIIENVLSLPIFNGITDEDVKKEFLYYDSEFDTSGSIDLLMIKDGIYTIVDYKSSDISHEEYIRQLHVYQHNVERLFHIDSSHIRLYLLSLMKGEVKEVQTEDK